MDASALRWALAIIGVVLLVGIYLYGLQQNRLRKRAARDTFAREEIDSAFIEDEQLREELDNLGQIISSDASNPELESININPALEANLSPEPAPVIELCIVDSIRAIEDDNLVSHLLLHADQRLITGEELVSATSHAGLMVNAEGLLEYESEEFCFCFASLSEPGHFSNLDTLEFATLGLNCFFDLESCDDPFKNYETMLKKIDELVRLLGVRVYQSNQQLLTISDVTEIRNKLSS